MEHPQNNKPRARNMTGCHNIHALIHGLFHQSFILRENQALLSSIGVLPSGRAVLYCVQNSTVSLVSGRTSKITRCRVIWSMLNCFFGLKDNLGDSFPYTWQGRNEVGRFHPVIGHKGLYGEYRYRSTLFLTSALEGGEGSASRPGRTLPPVKTRYPL
jgi:hypothetical protein